MTWMDIIISAIDTAFELAITLAIPYIFKLITKKLENDKNLADNQKVRDYMYRAEDYLANSVAMVKQTFVDSLKAEGKFDVNAQKEAFKLAKEAWLEMMSAEMKDIVMNEIGDVNAWIKSKIEAAVIDGK